MSRRERVLTTPNSVTDMGVTVNYDLIRLVTWTNNPMIKMLAVAWANGRLNAGAWQVNDQIQGNKTYRDADYDLIMAGASTVDQQQDAVYADLEAEMKIGPGADQSY